MNCGSRPWQVVHQESVVADTHNDLLMAVAARPVAQWGSFFRQRWLPQLRDGGVDIQVLPVFVDDTFRPEGALRQTLRMIECAHRLTEENADQVAVCRTGGEIADAVGAGKIALVLALESAPGVDADVELFSLLFRLGVRIASVTHMGRTALADGSGEDATGSRLTTAGVEAVHEMQRLGIIFDVSHLGRAGVEHVLGLVDRPVMATHSSSRQLRDHHRNLLDDHARGVAHTGGVVCVNFCALFLHETDTALDRLLDHIEYLASVCGLEHVGLGPDFVKEVLDDVTPPCCETIVEDVAISGLRFIPGLEGPSGLPMVTRGLLRRGWAESDVRKVIGENVRRLFDEELGQPASAQLDKFVSGASAPPEQLVTARPRRR